LAYRSQKRDHDGISYHKSCYASYTSKTNLKQHAQLSITDESEIATAAEFTTDASEPTTKRLRSNAVAYEFQSDRCIFCLETNQKQPLHKFQTTKAAVKVATCNQVAQHGDTELYSRLAIDLIAQEALYHSECYIKFTKFDPNYPSKVCADDLRSKCFEYLIEQLDQELNVGIALKLTELTDRLKKHRMNRMRNFLS